jgi:hypothetical protein
LRAALRPYLIRRRILGATTGALTGLAVAGLIAGVTAVALGRQVLAEPLVQWACVAAVLLPALARGAMPVSSKDAALAIERAFPFLQDRVATAVDVLGRDTGRVPRSEAATRRLTDEATAALTDLPITRAVSPGVMRTPALMAALGLGVAALAWAAAPESAPPPPPQPAAEVVEDDERQKTPPPPRIFDLTVTVQPPRYTGLPRQTLTDDLQTVRALIGSTISISGVCSAPDADVRFAAEGLPGADLDAASGGRLGHIFVLSAPIRWRLVASSERGTSATPWRSIEPIEDATPTVRILRPDADLTLAMAEPVEIAVSAADDFGVSALGLRLRLSDEDAWRSMPLDFSRGASATSSVRLNPAGVGLEPGGELTVRAWARDNDAVSGPRLAVSEPVRIRLEVPEQLQRAEPQTPVERARREEADAMEELQRSARELQRQLSEAIEGAQNELRSMAGEPGEAREMPTRPGMELQEAARRLREQAGRMEQAMRRAEEQLTSEQQLSPELVKKVRELHELMRDVLDEEMRKALEELQKAVEARNPEEMKMSLEQAREAQERFMQRLEQTMSLLKRARLEATLERLRKQAEELAERQRALSEQTGEMSEGALQASREMEREQKLLARDTQPLADHVEAAVEQAREVAEEMAVKLGAVADRLRREDPVGQMRQAASALRRGSPSAAGEPQQQAGRSLQRAGQDLAALAEELASDFTAEARRKLAEMLRDTLALSHSQEELREAVKELGERSRTDLMRDKRPITPLRRQQTTLSEATGGLAQRMEKLSQETPAMDPALAAAAQSMAGEMAQAAREIEGADLHSALGRGRHVMTGLNELAERLLETDEQLSQQSAQSTLSQYMQRLKSLAQRQQGLNQQTGEAQQGQSGQRKPGQGPGMSPSQMAYEQALIRRALRQMLKQGGEGEGTGPVGDQLGGVPEEMEKVEGDLRSGRIERETVERQERILEKMLEAQRSLYTKEQERSERKAERPEAFEPPPSPPAISPSLLSRPSLEVERGRGTQSLPRGYEDLVREYYRRLGEEPPR